MHTFISNAEKVGFGVFAGVFLMLCYHFFRSDK